MSDVKGIPAPRDGTAVVVWIVDVFDDEVPDFTPQEVARKAHDRIIGSEMLPILAVLMPDGTQHNVDLNEEGL